MNRLPFVLLKTHVVTFHLQPSPENYDSIIFGASMLCRDGTFYWADDADWSPESAKRDESNGSRQRNFRGETLASGWELIYMMGLAALRSNQSLQPTAGRCTKKVEG